MTREGLLRHAGTVYHASRSVLRAVPADRLEHRPQGTMMSVSQLIRHLGSACGASFKMVLEHRPDSHATHEEPCVDRLKGYDTVAEALAHLDRDEQALRDAVMALSEEEFQTREVALPWAPAVRVPIWMVALMMVDHLSGHRMQLFQYLRILGLPVDTATLYGM